jgi:hypothetical protein
MSYSVSSSNHSGGSKIGPMSISMISFCVDSVKQFKLACRRNHGDYMYTTISNSWTKVLAIQHCQGREVRIVNFLFPSTGKVQNIPMQMNGSKDKHNDLSIHTWLIQNDVMISCSLWMILTGSTMRIPPSVMSDIRLLLSCNSEENNTFQDSHYDSARSFCLLSNQLGTRKTKPQRSAASVVPEFSIF